MATPDYKDFDCEANGMTIPSDLADLKAKKLQVTVAEKMEELFRDAKEGMNFGVIVPSDYWFTKNNLK